MLKLTEGLFRMSPETRYADFMSGLYITTSFQPNIRSTAAMFISHQHAPAIIAYIRNQTVQCGVVSVQEWKIMASMGNSYTHILTIRFGSISSSHLFLTGKKRNKTDSKTEFPKDGSVRFTVNSTTSRTFDLLLRHPAWCDAVKVKINGEYINVKSQPSSYISLNREWKDGDVVELEMPMKVSIEELKYLPDYISIMRGPIVMAARFDNGKPLHGLVADDHRWAHIAGGELVSVFDTPLLIGKRSEIIKN